MASSVAFHTLQSMEDLPNSGFEERQARGMVQVIRDAQLAHLNELATKQDLAELRSETQQDIAALRSEMHQGVAEFRSEMHQGVAEFRSEMHQGVAELRLEFEQRFVKVERDIALLKWMFGLQTTLIIGLLIRTG